MEETLGKILAIAAERNLPFLLIGGNAVILMGYPRNTIDIDLLVPEAHRSRWLDAMRDLGYRLHHGTNVFAQFESPGQHAVDLMFVNGKTWGTLSENPLPREVLNQQVLLPRPEHLIALKLHAASSPDRSKPESDWEDIRQIIRACGIDREAPDFQELVRKFGGESALERIRSFR